MKYYHLNKIEESINNRSIFWRNGIWSPKSIHTVGYQYYRLSYEDKNKFLEELKNRANSFYIQIGNSNSNYYWHIPIDILNTILYYMKIDKVDRLKKIEDTN